MFTRPLKPKNVPFSVFFGVFPASQAQKRYRFRGDGWETGKACFFVFFKPLKPQNRSGTGWLGSRAKHKKVPFLFCPIKSKNGTFFRSGWEAAPNTKR